MRNTYKKTELLREEGKDNYFHAGSDQSRLTLGIRQLKEASDHGDAEATFILGEQMIVGRLRIKGEDPRESGMRLLREAEDKGSLQARALINRLCDLRYRQQINNGPVNPHPLTGFDGKPIRIDRTGRFIPVDAVLSFDGTVSILKLSTNIHFFEYEDFSGFDRYASAVLAGIRDWAGDYQVFGGQPLRVKLELTAKERVRDSVHVLRMNKAVSDYTHKFANGLAFGKRKAQLIDMLDNRRSFTFPGLRRWSVHSPKIIYMQSSDGSFEDLDELRTVARHEFGHILGLGDLYASDIDNYEGVEPGTYSELDCFQLFGKFYRAVMCDHHAPVSNNDIEMVIMAFSENKYQAFQNDKLGQVSEALGKGN